MVEGRRRCVIAPPSALRAATSRSLRGTEDQVGNLPPAGRARARCADGADIAEDILEEAAFAAERRRLRSEEHTSELQSLMRISYAVFCLKKKKTNNEQISKYKFKNRTMNYNNVTE